MKNTLFYWAIILLVGHIGVSHAVDRLFYEEPAKTWTEALPIGNGRMGAMVYGGVTQEQIQFNEETLWTGKPRNYARRGAYKRLPEIRRLLFEGKQREAMAVMERGFMSVPRSLMAYQPFGDLIIDFPGHKNPTHYQRELDIERALCRVTYQVRGVTYTREILASHPDQLIAIHLTADHDGALDFSLRLDSRHLKKSVVTENTTQTLMVKPDVEPQRFDVQHPEESLLFGHAGLRVITNGQILAHYEKINVTNATSATIYLAAHTNFVTYQDISGKPARDVKAALKTFTSLDYPSVRQRHIADYQSLYNRFTIHLKGADRGHLPTDKRIVEFWRNPTDPEFVALYVQYGRYLMISSSRPGTQPANLQGIWNPLIEPPWKSKYTTNVNAEMNYWPAEVTNLSDCHEPFLQLVTECAETGRRSAREHYGGNGWVLHHNTDIWRGTAPINLTAIGTWVGGAAWVTHHLWEHYLFTQDIGFLREKYPVIKEAALFYREFLVEHPETGWLVSVPSNSPEIGGLVAGPSMDHQLIRSLFKLCIKAADILKTDAAFADQLKTTLPRIAPDRIGKHGQLQEWLQDRDDPTNAHRHVSHLWAVHPGREINWEETPDLMRAARQSLLYRGDGGTGWSLAWKINFWARFLDGNHAYALIHNLLSPAEHPDRTIKGGTYPNLFDAHPPFQIDGNFGGAAGIVELMVQSHMDRIDLLPALPDALAQGSLSGVCARGGFELSLQWLQGKLQEVRVHSKAGNRCTLRYRGHTITFNTQKGESLRFNGKLEKRK